MAACLVVDARGRVVRAMLYNGTRLIRGRFVLHGKGLRRSRIASVDYENGIVEVVDPVIGPDLRPGQVVIVEPEKYSDGVTIRKVIDSTHFSIGDENLQAGGGAVITLEPKTGCIVSSVAITYAKPGMMVFNSRMEPVGHVDKWQRHKKEWSFDP